MKRSAATVKRSAATVKQGAATVKQGAGILTPREEKVLRMRFGVGESPDHPLETVNQDFEATRERIRQIEAKALVELRKPRLRPRS